MNILQHISVHVLLIYINILVSLLLLFILFLLLLTVLIILFLVSLSLLLSLTSHVSFGILINALIFLASAALFQFVKNALCKFSIFSTIYIRVILISFVKYLAYVSTVQNVMRRSRFFY